MPTQSYRRKQNPVNEKVRSDTLPVRPNPKALRQPTGLASCPMVNVTGVLVDEVKPLVSLPQQSNDYGTLFNDPQRVHEWCVASANGPAHVVDDLLPGHRSMSHSNNVCGDPRFSYQLGYPCGVQPSANLSDLSTKQLFPARATARALPDDRCNDYPEFTTSLLTGVMLPLEPFYVIDGPLGGECLPRDIWATDDGQIPGPLNVPAMGFPTPGDIYQEPSSAILDQYPLEAIWPTAQCHGGDSSPDCPSLYPSDSTWSAPSAVAMDPSLSSSCSQDSYVLHQAGSPTSFTSQEDLKYIISGEDCGISPLTMDGISSVPYAYGMYHNSLDTASTIRPGTGFKRPSLSDTSFWSSQDSAAYPARMSSFGDQDMRRHSNGDIEKPTARCDELYQIQPRDDGLYHCPFTGRDGCTHKPEKLKCNYDKHLDSHLKPYRCKVGSCLTVPFSSTACLLRHEREAHGMHGHGEKPFLCKYEDCDRSITGNGFPRRWNLQDHMKRVHDDTGLSLTRVDSPSPPSPTTKDSAPASVRKRRTGNSPPRCSVKRTKSPTTNSSTLKVTKEQTVSQFNHHQEVRSQYQHTARTERLRRSSQQDVAQYSQFESDYAVLNNIGMNQRMPEVDQCAILESYI